MSKKDLPDSQSQYSGQGEHAELRGVERRKQWQDRRSGQDRRNPERLRLLSYDCRTGLPRRAADRTGELGDGEVWWRK
ncbi:MAG TPA: hypothetical protein ENJ11_07085 [Gammaproteobacteria bacterium]|nr:hypothetical protein [Gammaproteobacteria bacterium]